MATPATGGARSRDDFLANQVVGFFRKKVYDRNPKGRLPLNALTAKARSKKAKDYRYFYYLYDRPFQGASFTAGEIHTDPEAVTDYVAAASPVGTIVYVTVTAEVAQQFVVGNQVQLTQDGDPRYDHFGKCIDVRVNGANSRIGLKTLHVASASHPMTLCDYIMVAGDMHPDFSIAPPIQNYDDVEYYQFLQTSWTTYGLSGRAEETELETGDPLSIERRRKGWLHADKLEKHFLHGVRSKTIGPNRQPETSCDGLLTLAKTYGKVDYFHLNETFGGTTWISSGGGKKFMANRMEEAQRYGGDKRLAIIGSGASTGLTQLAEVYGNINLTPGKSDFGLDVQNWIAPGITLMLYTHPLFSLHPNLRHAMLVLEEDELEYIYRADTYIRKDEEAYKRGGPTMQDGRVEAWFTDAAIVYLCPPNLTLLYGIGLDSTV